MHFNWFDLLEWFPSDRQGFHLLAFMAGSVGISIYLQRPKKKNFKKIFLAWVSYLAVLICAEFLLLTLISYLDFKIIIAPGFTEIFGMVSGIIFLIFVQVVFNIVAEILKIKRVHKDNAEKQV